MSDTDNTDEPLLEVNNGVTPDAEDKPNKPKKGKGAKLKDKFKRSQRLSAGDIDSLATDDATSARNIEELTRPSDTDPEEMKKKDLEKSTIDSKAFERKEQLKALGIGNEAKHSFYDKVKQANDKYQKSGFGKAADRLGKNMKTVGQGAEGMTEAALLETALYNMLMLLFELLFGSKKGIKKLPEGAKWLNSNRKREHLYSGALRRYAKEDHGKALKEADGLKKEIDDLNKERTDLKDELAKIAKDTESIDLSDVSDLSSETQAEINKIDERLKENKAKIDEKQEKYDAAMLKMAKAESKFKTHGDATKNEKWQQAMTEYKELLPKLSESSEKYKADKKIVADTPLLQRDEKRAELKLDQQKVALDALKQKELGLYNKIEKLEKSIGKTSAELAEMKKSADKDHKEGMQGGRYRAKEIAGIEKLASQKIDSLKKGEGLTNTKEALQKEQKEIKAAQAEFKKIPDKDKTPEDKAEKAALDKKATEIKGRLINLDGKKATLEMAVNKAQAKMDNFTMLKPEQKAKKIEKNGNIETKLKGKLQNAKENQAAYQKLGTDLTGRKEQLKTKIDAYPNLPDGDKKKTPERLEKLKNNFDRVEGQIKKYDLESSGQIAQNKQATDDLEKEIGGRTKNLDTQYPFLDKEVNKAQAKMDNFTMLTIEQKTQKLKKDPELENKLKNKLDKAIKDRATYATSADVPLVSVINQTPTPEPLPQQQQPTNTAPIFSTSVGQTVPDLKPKDLSTPPSPQQAQNIFATNAEPSAQNQQQPRPKKLQPLTPVKTLGEMVDRYAKMEHPVPQDQLMNRFQRLMIEGAVLSQQNSMREYLDQNPSFRLSTANLDSLEVKTKTLERMFAKAYLDHLKSTDSNIRALTSEQAQQVKAIAKEIANNPETTSLLKQAAEAKLEARVQALRAGAQSVEIKPESPKISIEGTGTDNKVNDKKEITSGEKKRTGSNVSH